MNTPTPPNADHSATSTPTLQWTENEVAHTARWRSNASQPKRVVVADDTMTADEAYRLACEGTGLLWRSDFQNARQLLQAMTRRLDTKPTKAAQARKAAQAAAAVTPPPGTAFHLHRQSQAQRARTLGMLLIPLNADFTIPLRRAPDMLEACVEAYGPPEDGASDETSVVSLRELLGLVGAHEWHKKGVEITQLPGERIHPHYGVFSPVRGEYLDLIAKAPLPDTTLAFDIGTGTGVIAALLARRGVEKIIATEIEPRALACAQENIARLNLSERVEILATDMFPEGRAPLIVCNPPWIPARPSSTIEQAIYDPDSRMLRSFLSGLAAHLAPKGEGWLILSDFAEHLGLRTREELMAWIAASGLKVLDKLDISPQHPKAQDAEDPLHLARKAEVTSLWRLVAQ